MAAHPKAGDTEAGPGYGTLSVVPSSAQAQLLPRRELLYNQSKTLSKSLGEILDLTRVSYAIGESPKVLGKEPEPARVAASSRGEALREEKTPKLTL